MLSSHKKKNPENTTDSKDQNLALPKKNNGILCRSNDAAEMLTSCQGAVQHCLLHCWKWAPAVLYHWPPNKGSCCDFGGMVHFSWRFLGCLFRTTFLLIDFTPELRRVTASPPGCRVAKSPYGWTLFDQLFGYEQQKDTDWLNKLRQPK